MAILPRSTVKAGTTVQDRMEKLKPVKTETKSRIKPGLVKQDLTSYRVGKPKFPVEPTKPVEPTSTERTLVKREYPSIPEPKTKPYISTAVEPITRPRTQTLEERATSLADIGVRDVNQATKELFDIGLKEEPETLEDYMKGLYEEEKRSMETQEGFAERQRQFQEQDFRTMAEEGQAATGIITAALAQGRETPYSYGAIDTTRQYTDTISQRLGQIKDRMSLAQDEQLEAQRQMNLALERGAKDLAQRYQDVINQKGMEIEQAQADLLNAQAQASQVALDVYQTVQDNNRVNLGMFMDTLNTGAEFSVDGIRELANRLQIPTDLALDYYKGVESIRQDKTLDLAQKELLLNGQALELDRQMRGITNSTLESIDYIESLYRSGASQSEISRAKAIMGLPDEYDPMYQLDLAMKATDAQLRQLELQYAGGPPPEGTAARIEYDMLQLDKEMRQLEKAQLMGEMGVSIGVIDEINGAVITQSYSTPIDYSIPGATSGKHEGLDYVLPGGTNADVKTPVAGIITVEPDPNPGENVGWGNRVIVTDDMGNKHAFGHLSTIDVADGQQVASGESLGKQGNTGFTMGKTGIHVDYRIETPDGKYEDPQKFLQEQKEIAEKKAREEEVRKMAEAILDPSSSMRLTDYTATEKKEIGPMLNQLKQEVMEENPGLVGQMLASAGGSAPTASFKQALRKADVVVNQMDELSRVMTENKIIKYDDEGNVLGSFDLSPLSGWLAEKNPWDTPAQEMKAILQGAVPNLARGIYGEVGVLTDRDIALYIQTLPNLRQTSDVKKAVTGLTLRVIKRSIESMLEAEAAGGGDVSGYVPLYQRIDQMVSDIEQEMLYKAERTPQRMGDGKFYGGMVEEREPIERYSPSMWNFLESNENILLQFD